MRILRIVFLPLLIFIFTLPSTSAQECYWVFFRDKSNTTFDPATYFHPKAIERRLQQGLPLCDSTDFPLNGQYKSQTAALSEEVMGESRWFNALAVKTFQIEDILALPFVKNVQRIDGDFLPATVETDIAEDNTSTPTQLTEQKKDPDCYVAEIRIPLADLGEEKGKAEELRLNLVRNSSFIQMESSSLYGIRAHDFPKFLPLKIR